MLLSLLSFRIYSARTNRKLRNLPTMSYPVGFVNPNSLSVAFSTGLRQREAIVLAAASSSTKELKSVLGGV